MHWKTKRIEQKKLSSNYTNFKNEYITWKEFKALNEAENGICNEFLTKYTDSQLNHFGFQTKLSSSNLKG